MYDRLNIWLNARPSSLDFNSHGGSYTNFSTMLISTLNGLWTVIDLVVFCIAAVLTGYDLIARRDDHNKRTGLHWDYVIWNFVLLALTITVRTAKFMLGDSPRNRILKLCMAITRFSGGAGFVVYTDLKPNGSPIWYTSTVQLIGASANLLGAIEVVYAPYALKWIGARAPFGSSGYTPIYLSKSQRFKLRKLAVDQFKGQKGKIDRQAFWYSPIHLTDDIKEKKSLDKYEAPLIGGDGQNETVPLKPSIFGRCYCCLDSEIPIQSEKAPDFWKKSKSNKKSSRIANWNKRRAAYLAEPSSCHFGLLKTDVASSNIPHQLCIHCEEMCSTTRFTYAQKEYPRDEVYLHWESPRELKKSADKGCHLCVLIWGTLNSEQQEELLKIDDMIENDTMVELQDDTSKHAKQLRAFHNGQRRIRIRVETPLAFSKTSHVDILTRSSWVPRPVRLIPHFGGTRIAQRWMNQRTVSRAVSMGYDPAEDWRKEQAESIIITRLYGADLKDTGGGPLNLPLSTSTGSDEAMSLIKTWLNAHEHCHGVHGLTSRSQINLSQSSGIEMAGLLNSAGSPGITQLPTRFIDVGFEGESQVRICTSESILDNFLGANIYHNHQALPYLALSHCWGKPNFLVCTLENVEEISKGLMISRLTQTFQDAISVTRRLGIRYLWIDSLCIIQNSKEDWAKESVTMKDVYANATFVIAALASWDSSESFFVDQNPLMASPCLVDVQGSRTSSYRPMYAMPHSKYTAHAWEFDIRYSRLRSRAWCFQEEQLAKRIVYFAQHQIFFLCKASSPHEDDGTSSQVGAFPWVPKEALKHEKSIERRQYPSLMQLLRNVSDLSFEAYWVALSTWISNYNMRVMVASSISNAQKIELSNSWLKEWWWAKVAEYSVRFLTQESDRLIALSGMAAFCMNMEKDAVYCFGLWGGPYLSAGLLWYVQSRTIVKGSAEGELLSEGPADTIQEDQIDVQLNLPFDGQPETPSKADIKQVTRKVPSWSWISTPGRIANNSLSSSPSTSRIDVEAKTTSTGETHLWVRAGALKPAKWAFCDKGSQMYYRGHPIGGDEIISEQDLERHDPITTNSDRGPPARKLLDLNQKQIGWIVTDRTGPLPDIIYCLRIVVEAEEKAHKEDFQIPWATRGLILTPADKPGQPNHYRRLGYFELEKSAGGLTWPGLLSGPLSARNPLLPIRRPHPNIDACGFFDGCLNSELYII